MKRTSSSLCAASEVRDAYRTRIDLAHARLDLLVGEQGVVDALAVKVAVAHHFGTAEHFRVERKGAVHVLHREAEMLHALQSCAEWPVVAHCGAHPARVLRDRGRGSRNGQSAKHRGANSLKHISALHTGFTGILIFAHVASPC